MAYSFTLCKGFKVKNNTGSIYYTYKSENEHHRPYWVTGNTCSVTSDDLKNLGTCYPRKGEEFSILECNVDYSEFQGLVSKPWNALIMSTGSANIYGWIDKSEIITTSNKANTRVFWHIDWWLSALMMSTRTLSLLEGRIKRTPYDAEARPDTSEPRYWKYSSNKTLEKNLEYYHNGKTYTLQGPWAIVMFSATGQTTDSDGNIADTWTYFDYYTWPLGTTVLGSYKFPTFNELYSGFLEERIGINPENILGCWISPVPPNLTLGDVKTHLNAYCFFNTGSGGQWYDCITSATDLYTDDNQKTIIVDPYGVTYGTLPWKLQLTKVKCALDIGPSGAYLILDMINGELSEFGTGRQIQIPLLSVPITSNAMSSYVLSGQRDYDLETAKLQAEQSRSSGIANAGSSALSGAVGGAVAGGGVGAAAGAVAGLATSLFATQINYQLTKDYDQKSQQLTDRLTANQTSNVLISGTGQAWKDLGKWQFLILARDDTSALELGYEQSELGYSTDYLNEKCSGIMASGGGIRIESLHVEGLSPEGNKYIQNLFQKGCYLDILHNA